MPRLRFSVSARIYCIIGLSFCGLIGLAVTQIDNLAVSLKEQRRSELKHLAELASGIAREEYDTAVRDHAPDEAARAAAAARIGRLRYGNGDYFWINDLAPRMIMHPAKPELNGQDLADIKDPSGKRLFVDFAELVKKQGAGFVEYQWPKLGKDAPQPKLSYVVGFAPWNWVIGTGVYIDDLDAQVWSCAQGVMIAGLIVIVVLGGITLMIARRISSALVAMTASVARLGDGDFAIALPGLARSDELGDMARAIEQFRIKAAEKASADAAAEELRHQVAEEAKRKALQAMADTVERETTVAVRDVSAETERMAANAVHMTGAAVQLGENSSTVAAAAENALTTAQTVAAASAELSSSIAHIATQVTSSRALTVAAVTASGKAQATIEKLSQAAHKVGAVTNLISEIASQTNLLALNATIEAARAGEAGRGFAVVASEVKSLAQQTASATGEIAQQIAEIQEATRQSVESINAIGDVIRSVDAVSTTIATAVEQQSAVTGKISQTVDETSDAAREVAAQIVTVSNEAVETGRRAAEIQDGSAEIAAKIDNLRAVLVRAIRTATTDVDRREAVRRVIDRPGTIEIGGKTHPIVVRELSVTGATMTGLVSDAGRDTPVKVRIDGMPGQLAGTIVRTNREFAVVQFARTGEAARLVESLMTPRLAA